MDISDAALRHLASRSRTSSELKRYLAGRGFQEEEIRGLIADFEECGYLNDGRYCREYFEYAFGKGKGRQRVFAELREKGVDSTLIENAYEDYCLEEGEPCERERAMEEVRKVLGLTGVTEDEAVPEKVLARIGRRLSAKGYSGDIIYSVIGELRR